MTQRNGAHTYFTRKHIGLTAAIAIAVAFGLCAASPSHAGRLWSGAAAIKSCLARQLTHVHFRKAAPQYPDHASGDADDYVQQLTSIRGAPAPWE